MKLSIACLTGAVSLIAALGHVSAQTTVTYEIGSRTNLGTTEIHFADTLPLFDSNLGVLTGATLTLFEAARTSVFVYNHSPQTQTFDLQGMTYLYWNSGNSYVDSLLASPPGPGNSFNLVTQSSGFTDLGAGQSVTVGPLYGEAEHVIDLATHLAQFQSAGGGLFDLSADTLSGLSVAGGGGNINTSQQTSATVHAMITYTYTPVPEPSVVMLGFAAGAFGLIRRRRG